MLATVPSGQATIRAVDVEPNKHGRTSYTLITPEGTALVRLQFIGDIRVPRSRGHSGRELRSHGPVSRNGVDGCLYRFQQRSQAMGLLPFRDRVPPDVAPAREFWPAMRDLTIRFPFRSGPVTRMCRCRMWKQRASPPKISSIRPSNE